MNLSNLYVKQRLKNIILTRVHYISCWSCGKNISKLLENLFCSNCKVLQPPDGKENHFTIMGIKETFDVNELELAQKYKDLQKNLHPDKFANKDEREQEISTQFSSLVNEAYKTLSEPLSRGVYMLSLSGNMIPENTEVDKSFLMEIMEKNEEVENADSEAEILRLNDEIKAILGQLQNNVSKAFFEGDYNGVIQLLSQMKYYTSIDNQIQNSIRSKNIIR